MMKSLVKLVGTVIDTNRKNKSFRANLELENQLRDELRKYEMKSNLITTIAILGITVITSATCVAIQKELQEKEETEKEEA